MIFVQVEMQVPWVPKEKPCQETEFSLNSFSLSMNIIRKQRTKGRNILRSPFREESAQRHFR